MFWHNHYEHLRNCVLSNYFQEKNKNSKETWINTNEVLNNHRKKHGHIYLSENETIITNGKMFPNQFNNYV